jgi:hypothetical protein
VDKQRSKQEINQQFRNQCHQGNIREDRGRETGDEGKARGTYVGFVREDVSQNCKKNYLFYQSICYPLRLLKNSSGHHLR